MLAVKVIKMAPATVRLRSVNYIKVCLTADKSLTPTDFFFDLLDLRDAVESANAQSVRQLSDAAAQSLLEYITANSSLTEESIVQASDSAAQTSLSGFISQHVRLPLREDKAASAFEAQPGAEADRITLRLKAKQPPRGPKRVGKKVPCGTDTVIAASKSKKTLPKPVCSASHHLIAGMLLRDLSCLTAAHVQNMKEVTKITGLQTPAGSKVLLDVCGFNAWWEPTNNMLPLTSVTHENVHKAVCTAATRYEVRSADHTCSAFL